MGSCTFHWWFFILAFSCKWISWISVPTTGKQSCPSRDGEGTGLVIFFLGQ